MEKTNQRRRVTSFVKQKKILIFEPKKNKMEKKRLTEAEIKKLFPPKEELEIKRREIKKKDLPVGCRTYGMVKKSEKEPCDDPRCGVCRNRKEETKRERLKDLEWQERRDKRRVEGYSLGTFETEEELLEQEVELKKGNYAFVKETMFRFCGKEWKKVIKK